jgi:hypothetical protein
MATDEARNEAEWRDDSSGNREETNPPISRKLIQLAVARTPPARPLLLEILETEHVAPPSVRYVVRIVGEPAEEER